MGATVLDGAVIEAGGVLAAGALLAPGKRIGRNELWMGSPARFARVLGEEERAGLRRYRRPLRGTRPAPPRLARITFSSRHPNGAYRRNMTGVRGTKIMRRIALLVGAAALALVAGCSDDVYRLPSTAVMPAGALNTNGDIDVRSLDIASYGFGHYDEIEGQPSHGGEHRRGAGLYGRPAEHLAALGRHAGALPPPDAAVAGHRARRIGDQPDRAVAGRGQHHAGLVVRPIPPATRPK